MKLFTKDIDKKLFAQYDLGANLETQKVIAKIFNPYGRGTWYIINSDPSDPDYLWAIVDLFEVEAGSVSRNELESLKVPPFGLHLERDSGFSPINAAELYKGLLAGKHYKEGGETEQSENKEMVLSQAEELEHHVEEFEEAAKKSNHVPAWIVAKAERAATDMSDAAHYLDAQNELKREEKEGEEEYALGGEVKWQEADFGDSALVVSENKMGIIIKPYGRKFHLKFVDGTEKTYDANDLKFFKDIDEFDLGGEILNRELNIKVRELAEKKGLVPKKLGRDYETIMAQAAVSAFRDANFHSEAKKLVSALEKESWNDELYQSTYYNPEDEVDIFGKEVASLSKWNGTDIANAFIYILRINGEHRLAAMIGKSMEDDNKMAKGGWIKSDKQEDFYYYSTPDKKIKTPFWYSVHEVKDIGSKETLHWTVERGGTNDMGYLRNYARKNFESKDEALKYAKSWEKEIANKYKWSRSKMAEGGLISYANNDYENKLGNFDSLEKAKKFAKANKYKYESITFEDENGDNIVVSKDDSFKAVDWLFSNKMADYGMMKNGGGTSSPNSQFMKWFVDWSKSVNKYVYVSITKPNEFSSPVKDDSGKIVILDVIEKKGDTDAKKYINEMLKKADEFGVSIYLQPIPRTNNLKSQEHKNKITEDYLIKYYEKFGFENTDGGFMVRAPKMAEGGVTDPMATVNEISRLSGLRPVAVAEWGDKNNINLSILLKDLKSKKIKGMDLMTAIVGNPNNKYQKELLAKYSRTKMAEGGEVKFKDKVASIKASLLKRKKVPKVVQKDYGKTFTPAEAEDSAKRIVGAQTARERLMMRIKSKKKK